MSGERSPSSSQRVFTQLPSIPKLELDVDCNASQMVAQTDDCGAPEDWMSLWCDAELQEALHTLMLSKYAEPFIDGQSGSGMTLQAVVQSLEDGKYTNNADLFWSDVDACWDCNECTFAETVGCKECTFANEMRALAGCLELDFWNRWFTLDQCPLKSDLEAQLGVWVRDSWVMDTAADWGEWIFPKDDGGLIEVHTDECYSDIDSWVAM